MHPPDRVPGRTASVGGQEWLYFSGTAYLGMPSRAAFRELVNEGMALYGTHFGGSRLSPSCFSLYEETERHLAKWLGSPDALLVSSGTLAGRLLRSCLRDWGELVASPGTHAALLGHEDEIPPEGDAWISQLIESRQKKPVPTLITTSSVNPLKPERHDFGWLEEWPATSPLILVIDDSHGLGITGSKGRGILSELKAPSGVRIVLCSSLGKGLSLPGGIIAGPREVIAKLRNTPLFAGASPPPPAHFYAFLKAEKLYDEARRELDRNVRQFSEGLEASDFVHYMDGYPVFRVSDTGVTDLFHRHRIMISHFSYPDPKGSPVSRIILNALHLPADIHKLIKLLQVFQHQTEA
ncbi:MAG: aminotransferase class I/II-fold pyridoxal phosphate-dependent enzyme [Saprospiraceae bacterium]|nr:aminotransferase class I/II-fold pyridoxal phosphate-dependent enzyme [Saprospiraceae bacterium]